MRKLIPQPAIAVAAAYVAEMETHATLDGLFLYAGCPENAPEGSKPAKALAWLRLTNSTEAIADPLAVFGKVIENYMDVEVNEGDWNHGQVSAFRTKMTAVLAKAGLRYRTGGLVSGGLAAPTKTLEGFIKDRDEAAITQEFERAAQKAESEPREAVSAAANILESLCKHYIEAERLDLPSKQVLKELWNVVRKDLGFDPSQVADTDLKTILTGLIQIVDGLGAFRTHASSAHGEGPKGYRLQPRHSRLAVHAAHTAALFILESWENKKRGKRTP